MAGYQYIGGEEPASPVHGSSQGEAPPDLPCRCRCRCSDCLHSCLKFTLTTPNYFITSVALTAEIGDTPLLTLSSNLQLQRRAQLGRATRTPSPSTAPLPSRRRVYQRQEGRSWYMWHWYYPNQHPIILQVHGREGNSGSRRGLRRSDAAYAPTRPRLHRGVPRR